MPIRCISETTGVSERTINRWIIKAGKYLKMFNDFYVKNLDVVECQIDEMWSFVLMKDKTAEEQEIKDKNEIANQWIFIALDARQKMLIHWKIGKRTFKNAKIFLSEVKNQLKSSPLFTTDGWECYEKAFLSNFQKNENNGEINNSKSKESVSSDLKYAQVVKTRKKGKVVDIKEKIIFGNPEGINQIIQESEISNEINTTFVERFNGTARTKNSRLVRKTYSFSKKLIYHIAHIYISFVWYNFISIHSRLKKTAAQLSGLVDRPLSFQDVFESRLFPF